MENRKPLDKFEGVVINSPYRRGSEKYDHLTSRGSISLLVTNTNESTF